MEKKNKIIINGKLRIIYPSIDDDNNNNNYYYNYSCAEIVIIIVTISNFDPLIKLICLLRFA